MVELTHQTTVMPIELGDLSEMMREVNRHLMVAWINAELLDRAQHDVRKSIALYDADKAFVHAVTKVPDEALLKRLFDETPIRFYSVGV